MPKALIIAEKPSVAADIAKALGGFKKQSEYFESDEYVLSSAVGHLLELCLPGDGKRPSWKFESLPLMPDAFGLRPIERSEARLKVLIKLIARKDVNRLINACDAGREGELIFRYIVQHTETKKPIQRLWLQSMTAESIRAGFESLRPGTELQNLANAAVCRSESDWLVGINGTRALTAFNSQNGGFQLTPVGRVQTPTLALVVEREEEIKAFKPRDYWEVHGTFGAKAGEYPGRWFNEELAKALKAKSAKEKEEEGDPHAKPERLWSQAEAEAIRAKCEGKPGVVTEEKKPTTQLSPLLFDLTSLQREANGRFGLSARRTLQLAQALYERHKLLTYPRTDSRYLPEDYVKTVRGSLRALKETTLAPFAGRVLDEGWVRPNKRIFNNAKVSDHFAIIPTDKTPPPTLDPMEAKLYELVAKRFLAVFYPAAEFEVTTRITRVQEEAFRSEGKILRKPGWLEIYGREEREDGAGDDERDKTLVAVDEGERVRTDAVEVKPFQTKPPARFTEATLLSAMEGAGKHLDDEELREAMAAKGLGTPATRAAIIEGLLHEEYLVRDGRELIPRPKAAALFELLQALEVRTLRSAEMTGEWEHKLKLIEQGQMTREEFMKEIRELTLRLVDRVKKFDEGKTAPRLLGFSHPQSGSPFIETLREYRTQDGAFKMRKVIGGRLLEPAEVQTLLAQGVIGPLSGFRSRLGRPFSAALKLKEDGTVEFVFDATPVDASGNAIDPATQESVGPCPVDKGRVIETMMSYACEHALGEAPTCKFKLGKKILNQEISREQAAKLLETRRTDLLPKFISQRTKRPFGAFLTLQEDGKIAFEFPPRAEKPGGKKFFSKRPNAENLKTGAIEATLKKEKDPAAKGKTKPARLKEEAAPMKAAARPRATKSRKAPAKKSKTK